MSSSDALEEATTRLLAALEAFEESMARHLQNGRDMEALEFRLQVLTEEHERLKESLEAERRRGDRLASANTEVSERLDTVVDSVKSIMRTN